MALVHQKLYQSQDLSHINLREYIRDLVAWLMQAYQASSAKVDVVWAMEDVPVLIDTAILCGLILNELVSNALKHAFPQGRAGRIEIHLQQTASEEIMLRVVDNGAGMPQGFDVRTQGQLGLRMIIALGETQLQGRVTFALNQGVSCTLRFKDNLYTPRV
jgi:two-component sensor histidine kinase